MKIHSRLFTALKAPFTSVIFFLTIFTEELSDEKHLSILIFLLNRGTFIGLHGTQVVVGWVQNYLSSEIHLKFKSLLSVYQT